MKNNSIFPVLLSGGSGSRLWPLSRSEYPKQFLEFNSQISLFGQTLSRFMSIKEKFKIEHIIITTHEDHRFLVLDKVSKLDKINISLLLEPEIKNTAAALTLAALQAISIDEESILVVTPCDHYFKDLSINDSIAKGINEANNNKLMTIGINVNEVNTQYGYIKRILNTKKNDYYDVQRFIEKPNVELAKKFSIDSSYLWNSGIFILKSRIWIDLISQFNFALYENVKKSFSKKTLDYKFIRPDPKIYKKIKSISIDYSVMNHIHKSNIKCGVIEYKKYWSDLGSWNSILNNSKKDKKSNYMEGDVISIETKNSLIISKNKLVVTNGVNNLAIIETSDSILIHNLLNENGMNEVVKQLKIHKRNELNSHKKVLRPWGWYDVLQESDDFKVKRILIKPFSATSMQKHSKRAEHWVVVKGKAIVEFRDKKILLKTNESTYIKRNQYHRISNPFNCDLEIIETQSGTYFGEDDIFRLKDNYGRK